MSTATPAGPTRIAAVRGAAPVADNTAAAIFAATEQLLRALVRVNGLAPGRVVSAIFTLTADLDAEFPAYVARQLGWTDVPMLSAREIPVPGAMPRLVRVLLTVSGVPADVRLQPVYLGAAAGLRPDLVDHTPRPGEAPAHLPPDAAPATPLPPGVASVAASGPRPAGEPAPSREDGARRVRIALVGLGQIGGSIGLTLRGSARWHRVGFDADPDACASALAVRAVDEVAPSLAAACASAELAVVATPVDSLPALIEAVATALPPGAALLDTGSARGPVTAALERAAGRGIAAVGGHPIAGHEGSGFGAARAGLFRNAAFALLPARGAVPAVVERLVRDLGARPLLVDPATHDQALARTSHLPYLLACALRELGDAAAAHGLSGPGFRDMTRLAASDPCMAGAYCRANAREVAAAWRELAATVESRIAQLGEDGVTASAGPSPA